MRSRERHRLRSAARRVRSAGSRSGRAAAACIARIGTKLSTSGIELGQRPRAVAVRERRRGPSAGRRRNCHRHTIRLEWRRLDHAFPSETQMRLSRYFLPLLKETPAEAQIVSHQLMLRAGMVRQSAAGIYSWLPLGLSVLQARRADRPRGDGPGRLPRDPDADDPAGRALAGERPLRRLRQGDAQDHRPPRARRCSTGRPTRRSSPTSSAAASAAIATCRSTSTRSSGSSGTRSGPRFGVMRGREFYMKDNYSFDLDFAGAKRSYDNMFIAYLKTFRRMGLTAIPMRAASGAIGGDMSHEFQVLAATGESEVFYDAAFEEIDFLDRADAARRAAEGPLRRDRRAARPGELPGAGRPAAFRPRHRGRPDLLLRHQILQAPGRHRDGPGRPGGPGRDGVLRHRRLAPGRRPDRGLPRRGRDQMAGAGRALPARPDQSARRATPSATPSARI